jgi:ribosome-binding protein aMBF1 (putative translation factor)
MTQKDLANKINEKQTVVADYESGKVSFERDVWEKQSHKPVEKKKKAIPDQKVLSKMSKALGVQLKK